MNETVDNDRNKKFYKAAGAACFLLAAVCVSAAVVLIVYFVKFIGLPELADDSILFFIGGAFRIGLYIAYPFCII
ncbi:MAG: hypothetical protein K2M48_01130, partial [Clostridiales bacterium]|nr:hypothetical protein [Clostridiales bacterium]